MQKPKFKALAEWEKQELLMLAIPDASMDWKPYLSEILQSYKEFITLVSRFQKVLLIGANEEFYSQNFAKNERVEFFKFALNDTWIRDFGAIDVLDEAQQKLISYDFIFNAWGDKFQSKLDNALNSSLFKQRLSGELRSVDFILEGGSIDSNGSGVMLTTSKCLLNENRNAHLSKGEIENKLKNLFGLSRVIWLENGYIKGDDTDAHVDTLARFIAPDTIAHCVCEDESDEHYKLLLSMKKELEKTGFKLVELPLPSPIFYEGRRLGASYANFVFINGALIVPIYGDKNDEVGLNRLSSALPNLEILPLDARVFIRQNGSLHCACQNRFLGKR